MMVALGKLGRALAAPFVGFANLIARAFWALLGLVDIQQRALMTWAMIGAIVATSIGIVWGVDRLLDLINPATTEPVTLAVVGIVGDVLKMAVALMAMFSSGMVLIARGGEMTIKAPGGLEISARGAGAKELAKATDTAALAAGETPPAKEIAKPAEVAAPPAGEIALPVAEDPKP